MRANNKWVRALAALGLGATLLVGCGQPSVSPLGASFDSSLSAKSGKAWSMLSLIAHDNDLAGSASTYRRHAQDLARYTKFHSLMVHDTPGNSGVQMMGFNGQWFNQEEKELNSGDVQTVGHLLELGRKYAPAQNVALSLADHGGGIVRGIMFDDTSGHSGMQIPDLARVLSKNKVQVLMFDACLMNMLEVAYELKDGAETLVGAESVTYAGAWPYNDIGAAIDKGGSPEAVATRVVDAIGPKSYRATVSGIRTAGAPAAVQAVDKLARHALAGMKSNSKLAGELREAIGQGQSYKFSDETRFALYNSYRDMVSVMRSLAKVSDPAVAQAATEAEKAARDMVLKSWRDKGYYPDSNGVSIYAPIDGTVDLKYAKNSAMAQTTQWDEFLVELNRRGGYSNPLKKDKYPNAFPTLIKK